jgi:hypothetical protein
VAPPGMDSVPSLQRDCSLALLVAKAHRWLKDLEEGRARSIQELALLEKLDPSYLSKVLRLTLLAPDIVVLILAGKQPDVMTWKRLSRPFPMEWAEQRERWGIA